MKTKTIYKVCIKGMPDRRHFLFRDIIIQIEKKPLVLQIGKYSFTIFRLKYGSKTGE